jgi:hypothetical protein
VVLLSLVQLGCRTRIDGVVQRVLLTRAEGGERIDDSDIFLWMTLQNINV